MINESNKSNLISLIDNEKMVNQSLSVTKTVLAEFEAIEEARKLGIPWGKIAEAVGFPDKLFEVANAWNRLKRRAKRKEAMPARSPEKLKIKNEVVEVKKKPVLQKAGFPKESFQAETTTASNSFDFDAHSINR